MERGRFKKTHKKKKLREAAFLMYFPYAETLLPFQPAGLKRKGSGVNYGPKSSSGQHHKVISKGTDYPDSAGSEEELHYVPTRPDLVSKLRDILDEEQEANTSQTSGLPTLTNCSRSSSMRSADSPQRRLMSAVATESVGTYSQFLMYSPLRPNKALRRNDPEHARVLIEDFPRQDDVWDRHVRHSAAPIRVFSPMKTDLQNSSMQSPLRLPRVSHDGLVMVPESNTHSSPTLAVQQVSVPVSDQTRTILAESESLALLQDKPKTTKARVRKQKQSRTTTKSPRPKTSNQPQERRTAPATALPRSGPPAVADRPDANREYMLDVLLRNKTSQDHAMLMQEYVKRIGLPEQTRVFILYSQDDHMRRALKRRGWHENKVVTSSAFHLKWTYSDSDPDYRTLRPGQFFNHFSNNRRLTTKCGLSSCFRTNIDLITNPDSFYPRTYDLGDASQVEEYRSDYERTAAFCVVKHHAEYFLTLSQRPLGEEVALVNKSCLKLAMNYCKQLIEGLRSKCEHVSKYAFIPDKRREFTFNKDDWRLLMEYSHMRLPFSNLTEEAKLKCCKKSESQKAWILPQKRLMDKCISIYYDILSSWPQAAMEGTRNVWIVKPGQNSRGSGVHCCSDLSEIVECGNKMQARIVQKYIERPLLLQVSKGAVKFDIRQWVLVTGFDPLEVHIFNSCYLRLCTQPFTLDDLKDQYSHLANYSVQKTVAKGADETVWSLGQFLVYLAQYRPDVSWKDDVQPQLQKLVIHTLKCVQDDIEPRVGCFELYGFDIILDETLRPWLLEVNLSPACAERTPWLSTMLDAMGDGLLSIVLDGPKDRPIFDSDLTSEIDVKVDTFEWVFLYKGEGTPLDGKEQPPCTLEIVGERANLRKEKQLERRFLKEEAGTLIQRVARGFLIRNRNKLLKRVEAAIVLQKHIRGFLSKAEASRRRKAAATLVLQTLYRRREAWEQYTNLRKNRVITKLQSLYRRWKAKERLTHLKEEKCAELCQSLWRRFTAKTMAESLRSYLRKVKTVQNYWKTRFRRLGIRAIVIQRRWRGVLGRRKAVQMRHFLCSLLKIQTKFRVFLAQRILTDLRRNHAAEIIQKTYRMHRAVKERKRLRMTKAAVFIQRRYRSYKARQIFLRLRRAKLTRIRAAIRIQATIKGHAVRDEYRVLKLRKAAVTIQKVFRGHICRLYYAVLKERNSAAILIQKHVRKHTARKRFEMLKRIRAQEKERIRRKEQLRKEQLAKGIAASERLAQRTSEMVVSRQSPANENASLVRPGATNLGTIQRELMRRLSARPQEGKSRPREETTPQPIRPVSTVDGLELLPRPGRRKGEGKMRVKTAGQGGSRAVR